MYIEEVVHHIDGNSLNNQPNNLHIITRAEHEKCHYSLQHCISKLFLKKEISFINGKYIIKEGTNG